MDWDDWELATDIYPDLAVATHRTTNRPIPVQPAPLVPEFDEAESPSAGEAFPQVAFGTEASTVADDETPPEIVA